MSRGTVRSSKWDVFINHASEDKEAVARPLRDLLITRGILAWLDEDQITVGDSLRAEIDRALSESRYGAVILSPNFFRKRWPRIELDALATREEGGKKVILPIWHNVGHADVMRWSPLLADRLAVSTEKGIEAVATEIIRAIGPPRKARSGKSAIQGARVLVVDDEDAPRNQVAKLVHDSGMVVKTASDGLEAIEILRTAYFDVLVTDLMMPRMDGFGLLISLQGMRRPPIAIVLSASVATGSAMVQIRDLGAYWYLEKPANPEAIVAAVHSAAEFGRRRRRLPARHSIKLHELE